MRAVICICSVCSILYFFINIKNQNLNTELNHFKYLPMSKEEISRIKEITNYIESKKKKDKCPKCGEYTYFRCNCCTLYDTNR